MLIQKNGVTITCVDDWKRLAPPKSDDQWVEGRSAFELANAWCGSGTPVLPKGLQSLLESRRETQGLSVVEVIPEHKILFDAHGGEPRNADLVLVGHTSSSKVVVTIEAKADEPFGATIAQTLADALERSIHNARSRGVRRVEDLVRGLLRSRTKGLPHLGVLRYQLLTAVAGTLAYATMEGASLAVLIVHEFVTDKTSDKRHSKNADDYNRFLHHFTGKAISNDARYELVGPVELPDSSPFRGVPLLIGKVVSNCRSGAVS